MMEESNARRHRPCFAALMTAVSTFAGAALAGNPAGALAYACQGNEAWYLLAYDPATRREGWGHLGGDPEPGESSRETALREFLEESNCAFANKVKLDDLVGPSPSHQDGFQTYRLKVPYRSPDEIALDRACQHVERRDWVWVTHAQLLRAIDAPAVAEPWLDVVSGSPRQIHLWRDATRSLRMAREDGLLPSSDPCLPNRDR